MPIRVPHTAKRIANARFNGVGGWYKWGVESGAWHDHIGIVLSCDEGSLTVAEGNVGNKNVAGIMSRKRDDTIGCYIRIPADYEYDGWKIDYKTGEMRTVEYGGAKHDK